MKGLNAQLAVISTPLTAPMIGGARLRKGNSAATKAIAAINEDPWEAIKYPNAIFDQEQQRWTSDAETGDIVKQEVGD